MVNTEQERRIELGAGHLVSLADVYPLFEIFSPWAVQQYTYIDPWVPTLPDIWDDIDGRPYIKAFAKAVSSLVLEGAAIKSQYNFVDPWLELLEKAGWVLEDEDRVLEFATPFHRKYVSSLASCGQEVLVYLLTDNLT